MQISFGTWGPIAAITTLLIAGTHATARADLSACGEVDVQANANCVVVPPSAQCQTMCTPVTVKAACSAQLAVDCDAQCPKLPSVDCYGTCEAGCVADCTVDPGKFECAVDCRADCSGRCEAGCATNKDKSGCMASCSGACSVGCDKQCNIEPPTATCDARCKASCQGSCKVETNIQCQVDCQAKGYAKCEAEVTGGCKARCMANEGALFCDGNFVDTGEKLEECVDALKAVLDAKVMTSSSGAADCAGGTCNAEGEASVSSSCSVAQVGANPPTRTSLVALGSLLVLGLFFRRRRF